MNVDKNIKITLSNEEREAVAKVCAIVTEFTEEGLCDEKNCCSICPLAVFCCCADCMSNFEETLNDIANME